MTQQSPISGGLDLYIPMGSYGDNQKHLWLDGNPCKALVDYKGKPFGIHTLETFGKLEEVRNIYVNGPNLLEEMLSHHRGILPLEKIRILEESMPGDTTIACMDAIQHLRNNSAELSDYVLLAGSDFVNMTGEKARRIITDFETALSRDLNQGIVTDIYHAVSDVREEEGAYARIKGLEIDRKGIILNSSEAVRFGGNLLIRKEALYEKEDAIDQFPNHFAMRKIKKDPMGAVNYWWKILNNGPEEHLYERKLIIAKIAANWIKKQIFKDLPIMPYFTTSLDECNQALSEALGLNFKFVKTIGSADADEQAELVAARLNGKSI